MSQYSLKKSSFAPLLLLLLLLNCILSISTEKIDDSIHYFISFTSDASVIKNAPTLEESNLDPGEYVKIISKNSERFICKLPLIDVEEKKVEEYTGLSAAKIMETMLYKDKMCSFLRDVYWTYQVCHGRYVTQYHEDQLSTGQIYRNEYYLGNYDAAYHFASPDVAQPPTRRIENEEYPYFSVQYTHGTNCDLTGKPRVTDVVYICVENVQHRILSVTEVASCHYEIIIMTDLLCRHPRYRLTEKKDHNILCWNQDAKNEQEAKPKVLQRLDDFHDSTFKREYTITEEEIDEVEEEELIDVNDLKKMNDHQKAGFVLSGEKSSRFETRDSLANNPAVVQHTVNRILTGEDCIVGGEGWWKYELCYGKQVIQFHDNSNGERVQILLGSFDEVVHKAWVQQDKKNKPFVKSDSQITQINHLYSKGDICDETGAHRDIEVRIRCATADHSALAFAMHLTEPKTCQYVLTIDSERFCEPIQYADDFGLIKLERSTTPVAPAVPEVHVIEIGDELDEERIHEEL